MRLALYNGGLARLYSQYSVSPVCYMQTGYLLEMTDITGYKHSIVGKSNAGNENVGTPDFPQLFYFLQFFKAKP